MEQLETKGTLGLVGIDRVQGSVVRNEGAEKTVERTTPLGIAEP